MHGATRLLVGLLNWSRSLRRDAALMKGGIVDSVSDLRNLEWLLTRQSVAFRLHRDLVVRHKRASEITARSDDANVWLDGGPMQIRRALYFGDFHLS